ncbi:hypothetical protein HGRIS_001655 [Hohenbuehelia grisea]|uniref:Uncharacterized protein n=1 Tax=Hohenbuehelia grisea TaxID=104357 RepID=A0ABR3JJ15_9AGAR
MCFNVQQDDSEAGRFQIDPYLYQRRAEVLDTLHPTRVNRRLETRAIHDCKRRNGEGQEEVLAATSSNTGRAMQSVAEDVGAAPGHTNDPTQHSFVDVGPPPRYSVIEAADRQTYEVQQASATNHAFEHGQSSSGVPERRLAYLPSVVQTPDGPRHVLVPRFLPHSPTQSVLQLVDADDTPEHAPPRPCEGIFKKIVRHIRHIFSSSK